MVGAWGVAAEIQIEQKYNCLLEQRVSVLTAGMEESISVENETQQRGGRVRQRSRGQGERGGRGKGKLAVTINCILDLL